MRRLLAAARDAVAAYIDRLDAKIDALVAADAALGEEYRANLRARIFEETPAWNDANDRVCDAEAAIPFWARWYAQHKSFRVNENLHLSIWTIEDALDEEEADCRGASHDR